ncbi:MAG: DUF559 domain-containing protein [Chromatiales bacterium]|jgi:very-short-patch-repair endonuclease
MKRLARSLRKNQTDTERVLWRRLRNRQIAGRKFRRQEAIGRYVVDFVCLDEQLIVEIDGSQHADTTTFDQRRTDYLQSRGHRVLRFWDNEILEHLGAVLERIHQVLTSRRNEATTVSHSSERSISRLPSLPRGESQGEGEQE